MTIDDIKTYLRVDHDDDDNLINQLEKTADAYLASAVTDWRRIGMIKPPVQLGVSKIS